MKRTVKGVGIVTGVVVVLLTTLPFLIQVDRFRPAMVKAVNEKLNGQLELGRLTLSLWGRVHVGIDGLKVMDSSKNTVVAVKDAAFDLPYLAVLSGSPLITFVMKEPEIHVVKDTAGKLNLMSLMKPSGDTPTAAGAPSAGDSKTMELPTLVVNARFGVSVENAKLMYQDAGLSLSNTIDRLNLRVHDFSLSRKTDLELWAELNTKMGSDLKVQGPLRLTLSLTPEFANGVFKSASVEGQFSADDLVIEKGSLFLKGKGIPARVSLAALLDSEGVAIRSSTAVFHNAEIGLSGSFHKEKGADFKFVAKPVDLKSWSLLVPMLKEYELEGRLGLNGALKGRTDALEYAANISVDGFSAKGPHLKAKPVIQGSIQVLTDRIEKFAFELTAPGNSLSIDGKLVSFKKPQLSFAVNSAKGMDLDQWVDFPKPEIKGETSKGVPAQGTMPAETSDLDALMDPLRINPVMKAFSMDGSVEIAFIKAKGFRMDDLRAKIQMKDLVAALSGIRLKMYGGVLGGSFSTDLKPKEPAYTLKFTVADLDMQKAVESQFQSFKNTLTGVVSATVEGGGASFNPIPAKKHLQMKGEFKVVNGGFKSMDIAKMANEAIMGGLSKIGDKVPVLKGKSFKLNPNADSKYDLISSTFTIKNGTLDAPNFVAKAAPKKGVDLKGSTKMGLIDESLDAKWEITDAQRVTGADLLTVEVAGKAIRNFLAKSEKDPVTLPISVGCKWSAPCVSYTQVPEYLAGVAASRLGNVAKEVVKQKVEEAVKGTLQKEVGKALKGLFGR